MNPSHAIHTNKSTVSSKSQNPQALVTDKAVRSLADAIFKQLQDEGCQAKDIINVSSQLLGLVTTQLSASDDL